MYEMEETVRWLVEEKVGPTVLLEAAESEIYEGERTSYDENWSNAEFLAEVYLHEAGIDDIGHKIAIEVATLVAKALWSAEWDLIYCRG